MKKNGFTLIELMIVIAIGFIMIALVIGGMGGCNVSDGNRVGTITKFSSKGVVNKSYEGELVMGGFRQTENGSVANVWDFSVLDKQVADQIEDAMNKNLTVSLHYHQSYSYNPIQQNTPYVVTSVTVITNR